MICKKLKLKRFVSNILTFKYNSKENSLNVQIDLVQSVSPPSTLNNSNDLVQFKSTSDEMWYRRT